MEIDVASVLGLVTRTVRNFEKDGKPASTVTLTRLYDTSVDDLWDALTSKERIQRWFLPVEGELRLGGKYQLKGNAGGTIYHAERHPVAARVLRNTMAQIALRRPDDRTKALGDIISELLAMDEPRRRLAARMSGLDIHYDLGEGHPLLGRRMPDLDLVTADGPLRVFTLLHDARPVLLNLDEPGGFDITTWADRVQLVDAKYVGTWELPALGPVTAPTAVLIRPDGYVAWVGELTQLGLADALTTWVGPPTAA